MNPPPPHPRSRHRLRRILLWLAAAVGLYGIAVGIVLPVVLLPRLVAAVSAGVGRPVSIQWLRIDPFTFGATLTRVEARNADGSLLLRCESLYANLQLSSLLRRAIVLRAVRLSKPFVHVIVDRQRHVNLAQLPFVVDETRGAGAASPRIVADQVEIEGGALLFTDLSRPTPFEERFTSIHATLQHFRTNAEGTTPFALRASTADGDELEWEGLLSTHPLRSDGRLHAVGTLPETIWRYLQDDLDFRVGNSTLEVSFHYTLQRTQDAFMLALDAGKLQLRNLALTDRKSREVVLSVPSAEVGGATFDLASRRLTIASLESKGGTLVALRNEAGAFGLSRLFARRRARTAAAPAAPGSSGAAAGKGSAFDVRLGRLAIEDYRVRFEDRTTSPPATFDARNVSLHGTDLSTRPGAEQKLELACGLAGGGQVKGRGSLSLDPLGANLAISVDGLSLQAFQPYLTRVAKLDVGGGTASLHGRLALGASRDAEAARTRLRYEGEATVDGLRVTRSQGGRTLVGWKRLDMAGASLAIGPDSLDVQRIVWKEPELHLRRGRDGGLDTSWWTGLPKTKAAPGDERPARASGFPVRIGSLKIEGGTVSSWDASVQPPVRQTLSEMDAAIEGLASPGTSPFQVQLDGEVNGEAPVSIRGTVGSPVNTAPTQVEVKASNYGMTTLNPYTKQYLGQAIDRGKLAVSASYRLDGSDLHSDNHFVIDQLALGRRVETREASPVPVGLAMALLRDRRGKIALDVSVHGDVNDPGFSYRDAFARSVVNVITKVANTPFAVLGSLVGEGAELGYVVFAPGSDVLEPDQASKVDALAQALEDRPELRIDVRGTASATLDQGRESQLLRLAQRRAVAVRRKLVEEDGIAANRVYILEPALRPTSPGATEVRTELSLTAD